MIKDNRVQEIIIPTITTSGVASPGITVYTDSINGHIEEIKTSVTIAGSVTMFESGNTSNLFFNRALTSGTNPSYAYPTAQAQAPIGSITGYGDSIPFPINGPLGITIGSVASGTTTNFDFRIRY